jgi:ribosome maturation factor RimP
MRSLTTPVQELVEPVVTGLGYELVGVEHGASGRGGVVRIYIDKASGISIADCERVSRQVSGVLDVEDSVPGPYVLEVSSPGLDRPLFTRAHFERFVGAPVRVRLQRSLHGHRQIRGHLIAVDAEDVVIEVGGSALRVPFSLIERARLDSRVAAADPGRAAGSGAIGRNPPRKTRAKPR